MLIRALSLTVFQWISLTQNLCRSVLPRLFSHTDSRLLTVAVFLEFTPLYRTAQLILIKRRQRWGEGGGAQGGKWVGENGGGGGRGGRESGREEYSRGAGNHETFKQQEEEQRTSQGGLWRICTEQHARIRLSSQRTSRLVWLVYSHVEVMSLMCTALSTELLNSFLRRLDVLAAFRRVTFLTFRNNRSASLPVCPVKLRCALLFEQWLILTWLPSPWVTLGLNIACILMCCGLFWCVYVAINHVPKPSHPPPQTGSIKHKQQSWLVRMRAFNMT